MRKPSIAKLVYAQLFPNPQISDPRDFDSYVQRNLIQEVRSETVCFYGPLDCLEAQYPGLDYGSPGHRVRLGRFPFHKQLFKAFDALRLSNDEIQSLCRWEGTRWTRESYEKNAGVKIKDTTWDGIAQAPSRRPTALRRSQNGMREVNQETGEINEDEPESDEEEYEVEEDDEEMEDSGQLVEPSDDEEESEDEISQSIGNDLNRRLLLATDARARGEDVVLDPAWEQWLKEAAERGNNPDMFGLLGEPSASSAAQRSSPFSPSSTDTSILGDDNFQSAYVSTTFDSSPRLDPTRGVLSSRTHIPTLTLPPRVPPAQSGSIVGSTSPDPGTEAAA